MSDLQAAQVPADEQIRAYLDGHPQAFRDFLHRAIRHDPEWFRGYLWKETRIAGRFPFWREPAP
jgi:hypothetical protein